MSSGFHFAYVYANSLQSCLILCNPMDCSLGFPGGLAVKNLPAMQESQEMQARSLGWEDLLEEGMITHSSILAWRTPWTEEPGSRT